MELVSRTSDIANLHVEARNAKMAKNEDGTNEGCDKYPGDHARRVCTNVKFRSGARQEESGR